LRQPVPPQPDAFVGAGGTHGRAQFRIPSAQISNLYSPTFNSYSLRSLKTTAFSYTLFVA
jgi:hypothetical protein